MQHFKYSRLIFQRNATDAEIAADSSGRRAETWTAAHERANRTKKESICRLNATILDGGEEAGKIVQGRVCVCLCLLIVRERKIEDKNRDEDNDKMK